MDASMTSGRSSKPAHVQFGIQVEGTTARHAPARQGPARGGTLRSHAWGDQRQTVQRQHATRQRSEPGNPRYNAMRLAVGEFMWESSAFRPGSSQKTICQPLTTGEPGAQDGAFQITASAVGCGPVSSCAAPPKKVALTWVSMASKYGSGTVRAYCLRRFLESVPP